MRCKSCNYRLWNLRSRTCPECGTPFRPSDYEFALNSVQFCCPHCGQDYYGTGEKGHLRPFEFNCVRCKTRVNMDDMVCLPTAGVEEEQTQIDHMPWLDQRRSGLRRWLGTIGMALVRPGELLRATPIDSSLTRAWGFFLITWLFTIVCASGIFCLIPLLFAFSAPGQGSGAAAAAAMASGLGFALFVVGVGALIGVVLWALAAHGLLLISGGAPHPLRRTLQAMLYASGANIITAIPCIGSYFGWIWWLVSGIIALKEAQRVSGWRASLAVFSLPLLAITAGIAFYAWLFYTIVTAGPMGTTWLNQRSGISRPMTDAIVAYAKSNNGVGPTHPAELLLSDPTLTPLDFVVTGGTPPETVRLGATSLNLFESLDEKQQKGAIAAAVASAGPIPTVQKFGDFVFAYAGLNLNTCPPDSWIVIHEIPAGSAPGAFVTGWYDIGYANGATIMLPTNAFPPLLATENARRQSLGAPPIPLAFFTATSQPAASQPAVPDDEETDQP